MSAHPTIGPPARDDLVAREFDHEADWTRAATAAIASALQAEWQHRNRAMLLLSGGTTPAPVYRALSLQDLDWGRLDVGLVDERWLPATDAASNARLVRDTLLQGRAAAATLLPAARLDLGMTDAIGALNARTVAGAVVVLGMGPDGHTASLFPGMRGLADALAATQDYVAVDADGCAGAGPWRHRLSLTPHGLAQAGARFLLIRGETKRALFARALAGQDTAELPIRVALDLPGARLQTFWCPDLP